MAKKIEAAPPQTQAIENVPVPGALAAYDYGDDSGSGYENLGQSDFSVPFIVLLQALSPMVKDRVGDARAGQWYNTVTQELYPIETGFLFLPATTSHVFNEWVHRDKGGGFRGHHEIDSEIVIAAQRANGGKFGTIPLENGNGLVDTRNVYGVVCSAEGEADAMGVIAFKSTMIKSFRGWMSKLRTYIPRAGSKPPLYANLTRITSREDRNNKGSFFVPSIMPANVSVANSLVPPNDDRFLMAKQLRDLVAHGDVKINPDQQRAEGDITADGDLVGADGKTVF